MKVVYIIYKSLVKLPQTKIQIINHLHKYLLLGKVQRGHRLRRTGSHASPSCGSQNVGSSTLKKVNNNNNNNKKKKNTIKSGGIKSGFIMFMLSMRFLYPAPDTFCPNLRLSVSTRKLFSMHGATCTPQHAQPHSNSAK